MDQFQYSRPFRKGEKDPDNEFAVSLFSFFFFIRVVLSLLLSGLIFSCFSSSSFSSWQSQSAGNSALELTGNVASLVDYA